MQLNENDGKRQVIKESFSIPKESTNSIFDIITIEKQKYENIEIFLANLNLPNLPKDKIKQSIGNYVYYFQVTRNNRYKWIIKRCLQDFHDLFHVLSKKYKHISILKDFLHHISQKHNFMDPNNILTYIEKSLQIILKTPALHRDLELLAFFEVSFVPLEKGTKKYKECYVWKRSGGRYKPDNIFLQCGLYCKIWSKRWLVIREDGVLYTLGPSVDKSYIREILFFDSSFQIEYGNKYTNSTKGIILTASSRKLHLQALNFLQFYDIINSLKEACNACPYTQINRFLSFSPTRVNEAYCKWYIDAEDYYNDIYEVVQRAKEEIFIADWWLSPELYLKRPVSENLNQESRIDRVLLKAAEEGVRVNIIIYKEVTLALTNNSYYTKHKLEKMHRNIKVLRHPKDMIFLWSHHEKLFIVDQEIAFLGGLDLCYGRFDNQAHKLKDISSENNQNFDGMFPGIDYYNVRIVDFDNVKNFTQPTIDKTKDPRMPWHDIAIRIIGEPVKDLTRHFIQYWNFVTYDLLKKTKQNYLEVTVREQKGHSQTINNLMELSFIKEKEKPNKSGIMSKIQKKIQKTKESMKKILHKSNPSTNNQKKTSGAGAILDLEEENQKNLNELIGDPSNNEEFNANENEEAEELKLSKKKVSIYLNNKKIECEESLILGRPDTEEKIPEVKEELEFEMFNDEGISELKRINLDKNVVNNNNHLKLQFANIVDVYCPSNSNEKIGEVMETIAKMNSKNEENKEISDNNNTNNGKNFDINFNKSNINHQIISNEKRSSTNFFKKKGGFKKSVSINPEQIKNLPKIVIFEEPGKFNLEKERIFEMMLENNESDQFMTPPRKGNTKKFCYSHQNIPIEKQSNIKSYISDEKHIFKKQLEDFTSYNLDNSPSKTNFITSFSQKKDHHLKNDPTTSKIDLLKSNYYIKVTKKSEPGSPTTSKTQRLKEFFHKNNLRLKNNLKNFKDNIKHFGHRKNTKSDEFLGNEGDSAGYENKKSKKGEDYQLKNFLAPNPKKMKLNTEFFSSKMTCTCQILRSASSWSLGLGPYQTEKSIHMAYIQLIEQAKHFIYIENQFFISNLAGAPVENLIANAILLRIKQAYNKKEKFKVMIFVPLLPGFPGDIDKPAAGVLKIQLHWEYTTISRGGNSIIESLVSDGIDPDEYIHFFSLRAHDVVGGVPKTEIIYIHSKMMMVDDTLCLIGSANINDRSMIGSRDSEIAVVIEDSKKTETQMDGNKFRAAEFVFNLRINLFKEHFGLDLNECIDPLNDNMWIKILQRTQKNTEIFKEIFRPYPDDEIKTMEDIFAFEEKKKIDKYEQLKGEIIGHAVFFPLRFLERQSLKLPIFTKEYLVPDINFV